MKTRYEVLAAISLVATMSFATVPELHDVSFVQDPMSREVTIDFGLSGEPAVVTVDVLTNGTSIGYSHMKGFVGSVYRVVQPTGQGERHHISWRPDIYWPEGGRIADGSVQFALTAWATNAPPEWFVADLMQKCVYFYPDPELFPAGPELTNNVYKTDYMVMRKIHAAGKTFIMGAPGNKTAGNYPQRTVSFSRDFYISIFNLTAGQWNRIVDNDISELASVLAKRKPRVSVSWNNMTNFAALAASRFSETFSPKLQLVTSAQWEYACRAGTTGTRFFDDSELDEYAWYNGNSSGVLQEVGTRKPNPWMLYDMIGNVNEYTADSYEVLSYSTVPILDPSFPTEDPKKVYRGGAYNENANLQASATAGGYANSGGNVGFRLGWTLP